jgi:lipopolysaccharide export system protein LptC
VAADIGLAPLGGVGPDDGLDRDLARRAAALAKWRRRSRQVHFFRKALPAAIGVILAFGVLWIGVRAILSALAKSDREIGSIHLLHPTFYGRNEKGELYIMSAAEAVREGDNPDLVILTEPHLKQYPAGAPAPMTAQAHHGLYHEAAKKMDLSDHVVATDGRGYTFNSDIAHVDLQKNSAVGNSHVYAYGPSGSISADAYQVYDKGQHDFFTGNVHTHLTNQPPPRTAPAPAARPVLPADAIPIPFKILHGAAQAAGHP